MGTYRIHTMPTRTRAVGRVARGESITSVAKAEQVPYSLLHRWCGQDGVTSQHQAFQHPDMRARSRSRGATPAQRDAVTAMFANGIGYHRAALAVGISAPVAYALQRQWRQMRPDNHPSTTST